MHQRVEINSFLVTKLKSDNDSFIKYDIEASMDEIESEEDHIKLKYKFNLLSNPTNVKISVDGFTTIYGSYQELARQLSNDEKNIPRVVNLLYQEIFPFLYVTAKTMQIPCPAYTLSDIGKTRRPEEIPLEQSEKKIELEQAEHGQDANLLEMETDEMESAESLIQEQKISTV